MSHKRNLCGVWKAFPTLTLGSQRFPRITPSSPTSAARSHRREDVLPLHLDLASRLTGLTDNELALLKLALDKQPKGPTEDDVCELKAFKSWPRERIDKLLGTIKAKFLTAKSPRVLRWANRHLVFREPRERATKPRGQTPGRKRGEALQKAGRHKRGR